jgi:hypothetical protein
LGFLKRPEEVLNKPTQNWIFSTVRDVSGSLSFTVFCQKYFVFEGGVAAHDPEPGKL